MSPLADETAATVLFEQEDVSYMSGSSGLRMMLVTGPHGRVAGLTSGSDKLSPGSRNRSAAEI